MAWVVQIVPSLEQGLTNSRKTCKFRIQTSLSGTFTGDANGVKNTHLWHWWFPRASHVNVMPSPLPFPAEKRPCFSSLRSDRCLSSDLVALPTKQGCQCDHWRIRPGSRPSRQCCGPGWTPGMGVHSHAHRQVFPQSWCSQLVAGWRTQLPAKLPVSGYGLR